MFTLEKVIQLKDHEEIRLVAKRHIATIFWQLFFAFILIGLPFFFLFQIFATGPAGLVMFSLLILAGLFCAWRAFILWDGDVLIVSTARIVKATQSGLFARMVHEISADQIGSDAAWVKKGIASFIWNYGTITLGKDPVIVARAIPRPHEVFDLIQDMAARARRSNHESRLQQHYPPAPAPTPVLPQQTSVFEQRAVALKPLEEEDIPFSSLPDRPHEDTHSDIRVVRAFGDPDHQALKSLDDV